MVLHGIYHETDSVSSCTGAVDVISTMGEVRRIDIDGDEVICSVHGRILF